MVVLAYSESVARTRAKRSKNGPRPFSPPLLQTSAPPEMLQVFRRDAGVLGDARKHTGADFFAVVKREDNIRPPLAG